MRIKSLKLKNFRNYELLDLSFDENTNIFYGDNAQGKTNVLEAVYLSGTTKSHRGTKDRDMIRFGTEEAHIEATIEKNGVSFQIDLHLKKNSPKGIAINKMPIRKASELFGIINLVFFSPEDLNIIKNGPSERRRFIDFELSQLDRVYLNNLTSYQKIINQRNHLLKDLSYPYDQQLLSMLDIYDLQLASYGEKVIQHRREFMEEMNEIVSGIHRKLTREKEEIKVLYEPNNGNDSLEDVLKKHRERDLRLRTSTVGPHRDDICFLTNGIDIRKFGSQGQQRTAALSLKLSEIDLVEKKIHDTPILLLDDVLSELDKSRQHDLLDSIHNIQTLITCTGVEDFVSRRLAKNTIFHVEAGRLEKEH